MRSTIAVFPGQLSLLHSQRDERNRAWEEQSEQLQANRMRLLELRRTAPPCRSALKSWNGSAPAIKTAQRNSSKRNGMRKRQLTAL